jgi:hypothetical protein
LGNYTSFDLVGGAYFARTANSGLLDQLYQNIVCIGCNVTAGAPIAVSSPSTTSNINFNLVAGGRVSGRVTDAATGAALSSVSVSVFNGSGSFVASGFTDASGNYTTPAVLPTGTYYARTSNSRGYIDELYNDITCFGCSPTIGAPIPVTAGSTSGNINFGLTRGGGISGRAMGKPGRASNVSVSVYNGSGAWRLARLPMRRQLQPAPDCRPARLRQNVQRAGHVDKRTTASRASTAIRKRDRSR